MIKVIARCVVKEESIQTYKEIAAELVRETMKEEGVISYDLYQDINDPQVLTFIEEWESEEALELHTKTSHYQKLVPQLDQFRQEKQLNIYKLA